MLNLRDQQCQVTVAGRKRSPPDISLYLSVPHGINAKLYRCTDMALYSNLFWSRTHVWRRPRSRVDDPECNYIFSRIYFRDSEGNREHSVSVEVTPFATQWWFDASALNVTYR